MEWRMNREVNGGKRGNDVDFSKELRGKRRYKMENSRSESHIIVYGYGGIKESRQVMKLRWFVIF